MISDPGAEVRLIVILMTQYVAKKWWSELFPHFSLKIELSWPMYKVDEARGGPEPTQQQKNSS